MLLVLLAEVLLKFLLVNLVHEQSLAFQWLENSIAALERTQDSGRKWFGYLYYIICHFFFFSLVFTLVL